jgi:hypothetical protein
VKVEQLARAQGFSILHIPLHTTKNVVLLARQRTKTLDRRINGNLKASKDVNGAASHCQHSGMESPRRALGAVEAVEISPSAAQPKRILCEQVTAELIPSSNQIHEAPVNTATLHEDQQAACRCFPSSPLNVSARVGGEEQQC